MAPQEQEQSQYQSTSDDELWRAWAATAKIHVEADLLDDGDDSDSDSEYNGMDDSVKEHMQLPSKRGPKSLSDAFPSFLTLTMREAKSDALPLVMLRRCKQHDYS